jgi:hypothetical protein|tara:strand:- start:328 stop:630 length:303 start_codon:yes stop_codon:yes gene_type:complete
MTKNLLGKTRPIDKPYAVFKGQGPFGDTEVLLLKAYQVPAKESTNLYARWMVAVKTPMTYGSYDMGDSYVKEAVYGLTLVDFSDEYGEQYNIERKIEEYI